MKACDIIIPVWNELESTKECIDKLKEHTRYPYRPIIIDNGSLGPTRDYLESLTKDFPSYLLIGNKENMGFVKAVNQGIKASDSPYICLLNNDAYVTENWLKNLIETVESGPENIGAASPTSNVFGKSSCDGREYEWQELDSCKGFCMLIKRNVIERIGLFDEIYKVGYFEEKDFSRRAIKAGFICVRAKSSFVFHRDKLSFNKLKDTDEIFRRNEEIYNKRWGKSKNIGVVIKNRNVLEGEKGLVYKLLDEGHRIHIFFSKSGKPVNLKDHIQIRYFPIQDAFFGYIILFKLWERRRKKTIELVLTEDENILKFFDRFKFLHKANISRWENYG